MGEEGLSADDIYAICWKKSLLASLIYSRMLSESYGYKRIETAVKSIIDGFEASKEIPVDAGEKVIAALEADVDDDAFVNGLSRFDEGFSGPARESVRLTLRTLRKVLSLNDGDKAASLRFVLYYHTLDPRDNAFDASKLQINNERMMRIYRDYPDAAFALLKEQYTYTFEKLWKSSAYKASNMFGRYPGVGRDAAEILIEDLMCATRCYDIDGDYKSDLREIRNAFAHENYEYERVMRVKIRDETWIELEFKRMMSLVHIMHYKCTFVSMVLPIITMAELATMCDNID